MRNAVPVPRGSGVYLIAFYREQRHTPYGAGVHGTALHYCGWSVDMRRRLRQHRIGIGARLCAAVVAAGYRLRVVAVWPGAGRAWERQLKNSHDLGRYCPVCVKARARAALKQQNGSVRGGQTAKGTA